jgi:hypothetical protein
LNRLRLGARLIAPLVAHVDDSRAKGPRLDQLQADPPVQVGKERRAATQDHGADEEPELVDEAELDEGGGEARAACGEILARFSLQPIE